MQVVSMAVLLYNLGSPTAINNNAMDMNTTQLSSESGRNE